METKKKKELRYDDKITKASVKNCTQKTQQIAMNH